MFFLCRVAKAAQVGLSQSGIDAEFAHVTQVTKKEDHFFKNMFRGQETKHLADDKK